MDNEASVLGEPLSVPDGVWQDALTEAFERPLDLDLSDLISESTGLVTVDDADTVDAGWIADGDHTGHEGGWLEHPETELHGLDQVEVDSGDDLSDTDPSMDTDPAMDTDPSMDAGPMTHPAGDLGLDSDRVDHPDSQLYAIDQVEVPGTDAWGADDQSDDDSNWQIV